ncbi:MAG TPA: hypothetical protein VFU15_13295 [Bacteroidia bacterium]|nr:hypothetical protein [Bacteroidia bacterium]
MSARTGKISGLVRALEPAELPLFRAKLEQGRGETDKKLLRLFNAVCDSVRENEDEPEKKTLFRSCFPSARYNDQKFRYLRSDLVARLERFIAQRGFERDRACFRQVLTRELASRKAAKAYNTHRLRFEEEKIASQVRDIAYYQHCYESEFIHLAKATAEMKREEKSNIGEVVEHLDRFYLARKLQLCCEIFNVRNVLAVEHRVFLLDEILSHLKNKSYEDTPVIRIYFRILMTLIESGNEEHFFNLRELLKEHEGKFTLPELREMYQYVLNYCIKKINLGAIAWQKTLFEIYRITIENNVLMSEGYLSHWDYKNIVTISLRQKEYEWVKTFIEKYRHQLLPAERENAYVYNLANLYFTTGDYSRSLKLLSKVDFSDLYYQLDSKSILLKTYFELDEADSFFYHATAFRTFLKRNRLVSDYQRSIYLNLIRYTTQLMRAAGQKKKVAIVRKKVEESRNIADLNWLLSKINSME